MAKRPIKAIAAPDITAIAPETAAPTMRMVSPSQLMVDEVYQRNLSERSVTLIRKMIERWDWRRFKPPICAETDGGFEVIDGQHTAIGAASNPFVTEIPILVVDAAAQADRAGAFVSHNRDRIGITPMQLFFAALAAGDDDAVTAQQVCERAGVRILKVQPASFKPGDTLAVQAIKALCNRRGAMGARRVLEVLAQAHCAPVAAGQIKAVEALLFEDEYKGLCEGPDITSALMAMGAEADKEAALFAAAHNVRQWQALTVILFRRAKRGRRRAA